MQIKTFITTWGDAPNKSEISINIAHGLVHLKVADGLYQSIGGANLTIEDARAIATTLNELADTLANRKAAHEQHTAAALKDKGSTHAEKS